MKASTGTVVSASCPSENSIRHRLRRRLLALSYHAFARCVCLLLVRLGYEDVLVAGRVKWKGRNCEGGYDIEASLPARVGRRRIIVQAKQFDTLPIFQRSVDELRGTCLRAGATEALLITTSTFSPVVLRNARSVGTQIAPVCLLGGDELLDLLLLHRVGVREEAGGGQPRPRRIELDETFFDELSRTYAGTGRRPAAKSPGDEQRPPWLLTIQVGLPGAAGDGTQTGRRSK